MRNTVSHDARIRREADTLRRLGFAVTIAGVVSTSERERRLEIDGVPVVRLDPAGALRGLATRLRGRRGRRGPGPEPVAAREPVEAPQAGPQAGSAGGAGGRLRRLALTGAYYLEGIWLVRGNAPALVHANDYNTMWIGIAAKLLRGSRLIYDSHELWADRNGRPEWRPWLLVCEALFVRVADVTITASPGYAAELARRYRIALPIVVRNIPAATPARARPAATGPDSARPDGAGPVGVYAGGLMTGRGLEPAIRALVHAPELRLRLLGPGSDGYRAGLRRLASELGVADRLELADAVAPEEVVASIAGADFGLMLIEPVCRSYELTLPNKLFEYAAAGLPILSSDMPVIAAVVNTEELGAVVAPGDPAAVAAGMRRLVEPAAHARLRERVAAFARTATWERERGVLERVYTDVRP